MVIRCIVKLVFVQCSFICDGWYIIKYIRYMVLSVIWSIFTGPTADHISDIYGVGDISEAELQLRCYYACYKTRGQWPRQHKQCHDIRLSLYNKLHKAPFCQKFIGQYLGSTSGNFFAWCWEVSHRKFLQYPGQSSHIFINLVSVA